MIIEMPSDNGDGFVHLALEYIFIDHTLPKHVEKVLSDPNCFLVCVGNTQASDSF